MKVTSIIKFLLGATSVVALNRELSFPDYTWTCSSPPEGYKDINDKFAAVERSQGLTLSHLDTITIPVYVHVVAASERPEDGYLASSDINNMINSLNGIYRAYGFDFVLQDSNWIIDKVQSNWTDPGFSLHKLGNATHQGSFDALNIWVQNVMGANTIGTCTYPPTFTSENEPEEWQKIDGCYIYWKAIPPFLHGVLAHEIGHWLGLRHTFQERDDGQEPSCEDPDSDGIDDTPVHLNPRELNRTKEKEMCLPIDSCPGVGKDPIWNFMNYMPPQCPHQFTEGQAVRMHNWWTIRLDKANTAISDLSKRDTPITMLCDFVEPEGFKDMKHKMAEIEQAKGLKLEDFGPVHVNVHIHVIAAMNDTSDLAILNSSSLYDAMAYVNEQFLPYGFQFQLYSYENTFNKVWTNRSDPAWGSQSHAFRKTLYKGDNSTLNIWTLTDAVQGVVGVTDAIGIIMAYTAFPPYSNGAFLVHEIGHWLGLGHTFQDGIGPEQCDLPDADMVLDTPIHLDPAALNKFDTYWDCVPTDTCPDQLGSDPVHNFMNYESAHCSSEFTQGQAVRMHNYWDMNRKDGGPVPF